MVKHADIRTPKVRTQGPSGVPGKFFAVARLQLPHLTPAALEQATEDDAILAKVKRTVLTGSDVKQVAAVRETQTFDT
jgi:hypothetical protein